MTGLNMTQILKRFVLLLSAGLTFGCGDQGEVGGSGGSGSLSCGDGRPMCGTTCSDVMTDSLNCGDCGRACSSGVACIAGSCEDGSGGPASGGAMSGSGGGAPAS